MFTYTTCRDCGGTLHTTDGDTVHPACEPQPTRIERLTQAWLSAVAEGAPMEEQRLEDQINDLNNRPPRLREAALAYAGWGWPVFPLKARSKTPATRNGFKDATDHLGRIDEWWSKHPDANIGLPTGIKFDVIDIDVPEGVHSFAALRAKEDPRTGRGPIPDCYGQVATASGGMHLYVKPTGKGNTAGIWPGIDHRGAGGYVVAPPSTLGDPGRSWSWTFRPAPAITGVGDGNA